MLLPHITVKNSSLLSLKEHSNTINTSLSLCSSQIGKVTLLAFLYILTSYVLSLGVVFCGVKIKIKLSTYLSKTHEL